MKIHKDQQNKRHLRGLCVVLAFIMVSGLVLLLVLRILNRQDYLAHSPNPIVPSDVFTPEANSNLAAKQRGAETSPHQLDGPSSADSSVRNPVSVSMHAEDQGDSVIIKTNLGAASDGECVLVVSDGANSLTKSAPIIFTPEFSSCAGFAINKKELSGNDWQIRLSVTYDNKTITQSINHRL